MEVITSFNEHVPNEILYSIFQYYFSINKESMETMLVCKRWHSLLTHLMQQYESHFIWIDRMSHMDRYIMQHLPVKKCTIMGSYFFATREFVTFPFTEEVNIIVETKQLVVSSYTGWIHKWFPNVKIIRIINSSISQLQLISGTWLNQPKIEYYWCDGIEDLKTCYSKLNPNDLDLAHDLSLIFKFIPHNYPVIYCDLIQNAILKIPESTQSLALIVKGISEMHKYGKLLSSFVYRLYRENCLQKLKVLSSHYHIL
jgi:hypothetical protein